MKGAPRETDERDAHGQAFKHPSDRLRDVAGALFGRRHTQAGDVRRVAHGSLEYRALAGLVVEVEAHRDEHRQQVGEHDRGIHAEDALRVEGGLRGEFGAS